MISKYEFELLNLMSNGRFVNQRNAAAQTKLSLGTINSTVSSLLEKALITEENTLTDKGKECFATFKVDNAIIMAAGMSSRFAPLSYEQPKGLLRVKGDILIERQIKQLHEVGITDITIVLGYMKEKFFYLEEKYNVKIVINTDYYRYNNTSTLMLVLKQLKNTYICSSDNYFAINVFNTHEYKATYPVQKHDESEAGEYYATFNKQGLITDIEIGQGTYCMIGHVFFDREFSSSFSKLLVSEYEKEETKTKLWEKVYLEHRKDFTMYAKEYDPSEILEFDSLSELQSFDSYYLTNTDSRIFANIMKVLDCALPDIKNIEAIKAGLTNLSFKFTVNDVDYIYRHPGVGTDQYINRPGEAFAMKVAKEQDLDSSFIYMDAEEGWKIAYFINDAHTMDYHNEEEVKKALKLVRRLHDLQLDGEFEFNIWEKTAEFIDKISQKGRTDFADFDTLHASMTQVYEFAESDNFPKILCHCDFYDPNILIKGDDVYLIDWEYAGVDDPGVDIGTFVACSDYTFEEAMEILDLYEGKEMDEARRRHFIAYIALASYYWFIWAIFQESNGAAVGEYLYIWYRSSVKYAKKTIELYGGSYENN